MAALHWVNLPFNAHCFTHLTDLSDLSHFRHTHPLWFGKLPAPHKTLHCTELISRKPCKAGIYEARTQNPSDPILQFSLLFRHQLLCWETWLSVLPLAAVWSPRSSPLHLTSLLPAGPHRAVRRCNRRPRLLLRCSVPLWGCTQHEVRTPHRGHQAWKDRGTPPPGLRLTSSTWAQQITCIMEEGLYYEHDIPIAMGCFLSRWIQCN